MWLLPPECNWKGKEARRQGFSKGVASGDLIVGARLGVDMVSMVVVLKEERVRWSMSRELRVVRRCQRKGRMRERESKGEDNFLRLVFRV